jgi:hypothetical protein
MTKYVIKIIYLLLYIFYMKPDGNNFGLKCLVYCKQDMFQIKIQLRLKLFVINQQQNKMLAS